MKWPTLKGRLSQPITTTQEAIEQLRESGFEVEDRCYAELDGYDSDGIEHISFCILPKGHTGEHEYD